MVHAIAEDPDRGAEAMFGLSAEATDEALAGLGVDEDGILAERHFTLRGVRHRFGVGERVRDHLRRRTLQSR